MKKSFKFLLFGFFVFIFGATFTISFAQTDINGDVISTDTTWTKDAGPYVIYQSPIVDVGSTLTIESGTVIKFDYGQDLTVLGHLLVNGTSDEQVYFTSLYDDFIGGDTDLDEGLMEPYNNDWTGIQISGGGTYSINNSFISYAETAIFSDSSSGNFESVNIENCQDGINIYESQLNINNINIEDLAGDLITAFSNSTIDISNSNIKNIGGDGVFMYNNSNLYFKNSNLDNLTNSGSNSFVVFSNVLVDISNSTISNIYSNNAILAYNNVSLNFSSSTLKNIFGNTAINIYDYSGVISTLNILNSEISGGSGIGLKIYTGIDADIKNTKIRNFNVDGIQTAGNSNIFIENSEISGNGNGITSWGTNLEIKNSIIENNVNYGITNNPAVSGAPSIKAINNWWGDKTGPFNADTNASGTTNQVSWNVESEPWLRFDPRIPRKIPVIIVPGLLGTELKNDEGLLWLDLERMLSDIGDSFMDKLAFSSNSKSMNDMTADNIVRIAKLFGADAFNYSGNLINSLITQGYSEGTSSNDTLFVLPYDWRYGVSGIMPSGSTTVDLLKQKIADVVEQTGSDKVDIIAHSTGGLIVKKYVIDNSNDHYINKAVFVGVPNTGAPKAVQSLIEGDNAGIPWLSSKEMKKLFVNFPIAYDLIPSEQYYKVKGSYIKTIDESFIPGKIINDLNFEEVKNFLTDNHLLNSFALTNANSLHTQDFDNFDMRVAGIDLYSINGCKAGTLGKITEVRYKGLSGLKSISYEQPVEVPGDNTVPLESSTNLPIDQDHKFYALKADHGKMMSQDGIKEKITNIISSSNLLVNNNLITQDISRCQLNGKAISVFSPIDLYITDQDGNHSGIASSGNIINDIPNADVQVWGDHKFIYLPTDEGQVYSVDMRGTGKGTYTIKSNNISDGEYIKTDTFSNLPVTDELIGIINISSPNTFLSVQETPSSTVKIINPDSQELIAPNKAIISAGSSLFIKDTATRPNVVKEEIATTSTKIIIATTTIVNKNLSKNIINKKITKNLSKLVNNDVATVYQADMSSSFIDKIKSFLKKVFFFWKK